MKFLFVFLMKKSNFRTRMQKKVQLLIKNSMGLHFLVHCLTCPLPYLVLESWHCLPPRMFYAWFIVFVGVLMEFSVGMLLMFSKASGVVSYGGIMGDAFGNVGRRILEVSVVINNIGVLTVYIIIIGMCSMIFTLFL